MVTSHILTGTTLGDYEIGELLGKGGMGDVYQAVDTRRERTVALKLLGSAIADDPVARDRFLRESRVAATLTDPHVLPIHDWGEIDGRLYIDMRLVSGRDLRRVITDDGPMPAARAVDLIDQIGSAVDAAHRAGLIHRDIKPDNILVDDRGFAYLVDFGLATHLTDTRLTQAGYAIGSFRYMAPERFGLGDTGPAVDIYALTCVLYECLVGVPPFSFATTAEQMIAAHLNAAPQRFGSPFDDVIGVGMAKLPASRYADAGSLVAAARAALAQSSEAGPLAPGKRKQTAPLIVQSHESIDRQHSPDLAAQYAPTTVRTVPTSRGRRLTIALALAAAIAAGLVGWYFASRAGTASQPDARPATSGATVLTVITTAAATTPTQPVEAPGEIVWRATVGGAEVAMWLSSTGYNWLSVSAPTRLRATARIWSPESGWQTSQVFDSAPTEFRTPQVYAPGNTCVRIIVEYGTDTLNNRVC